MTCPECHSFLPSSCSLCRAKIYEFVKEKYEKKKEKLEAESEGLFTWNDYDSKEGGTN